MADLRTGTPVVELQGMCRYDAGSPPFDQQPGCVAYPKTPFPFQIGSMSTRWSPDGTMIASVDTNTGSVVVWDARTGAVRFLGDRQSDWGANEVMFTPDSKGLVVSWTTGVVETLSTETWKPVTTATLDPSVFGVDELGLLGFTSDGSTILAVGGLLGDGDATLIWLDAATLKITKTVGHGHQGSPKSLALSPDGSLIATGASDGILRIWDTKTGELQQQMDFKSEVQGVAFIDDRHVAVTPQGGDLLFMTIDPAELANVLRASLTRTFTATECTTHAIDPCPTLAEMRGGN